MNSERLPDSNINDNYTSIHSLTLNYNLLDYINCIQSSSTFLFFLTYLGGDTMCLDRMHFRDAIIIYIVLIHLPGKSIHKVKCYNILRD